MKESSGELSMTLIVIVAAGVVLSIFLAFREPITNFIAQKWSGFSSGTSDNKTKCTTDSKGKTTCKTTP